MPTPDPTSEMLAKLAHACEQNGYGFDVELVSGGSRAPRRRWCATVWADAESATKIVEATRPTVAGAAESARALLRNHLKAEAAGAA